MTEEVKDETVNEETSNSELETETETETTESASEVTTSPTVEGDEKIPSYVVQLEQRITSLEQRFNGQEQQQQQTQEPPSQQDNSSNEQSENDTEDDGIESDEEIKKILGL